MRSNRLHKQFTGKHMAVETHWDNWQKKVLVLTYSQKWDWDDFKTALHTYQQALRASSHAIHTISIMPPHYQLPQGAVLPQLTKVAGVLNHPRSGRHMLVNTQMLLTIFFDVMRRTNPTFARQVTVVKTIEEARRLLNEIPG
jgi:hypothetical protein